MNAKNIDIIDVGCFGYEAPKKDCWLGMLKSANTYQDVADLNKFKENFKWNVEASYYRLCGIIIKDLDTDFEYFVSFINGKKKWDVEITDSKSAEVLPEEKKAIFENEMIKKTIAQAYSYIFQAKEAFEKKVQTGFKEGVFDGVDELKLESVLKDIDDKTLMDNFKKMTFLTSLM